MFSVTRRTNPEPEQPKAARYSCARSESLVGSWLLGDLLELCSLCSLGDRLGHQGLATTAGITPAGNKLGNDCGHPKFYGHFCIATARPDQGAHP